jgi:hypothetical protein
MKKSKLPLWVIVIGLSVSSCAQKTAPKMVIHTDVSRVPTSEISESPWTTWSQKGTIGGIKVLSHIRETLLNNNLHDPHVDYKGYAPVDCSKRNTKFRSADGTCTNLESPHVGASGTAFGRNVPPEYIVHDSKENLMEPNPSVVSKEFFTRAEFKPVPFLNMLAASWIQFMNHDWLFHGRNNEKKTYHVEGHATKVEYTKENPVDESHYKREFGKVSLNEATHWWDGSQIYGSNQDEQNKVRSFSKGRMTTVKVNGRELLPKSSDLNPADNKLNRGLEVTGFRDNWWAGLSMLHHIFVLEHNAIADMLFKKHVKLDTNTNKWVWNQAGFLGKIKNVFTKNDKDVLYFTEKELDEHIFQTARLINAAVMAKIHTVEWTPAILANKTLKKALYANWYGAANPQTWSKLIKNIPGFNNTDWFSGTQGGYLIGGIVGDKTNDFGVPYSITEEFTSVYRLHSLLPEALNIKSLSNKNKVEVVPFGDVRSEKSYTFMANHDLKDLFYSFGTQHPGQLVLQNFPKFMQELTIAGHGTIDMGMMDVLRDRERGVPRYNQFRKAIGLIPIKRYSDFFPGGKPVDERQKEILRKFKTIYGQDEDGNDNVEMIDLLVGTLAEEVRPENFGFGETQFQIFILMASRRLMADRFFTENYRKEYYTKAGLEWIDDEGWFHKVILRHMPELKPHLKGLETAFRPWNK